MSPRRERRARHTQIHLPPLTGDEACRLVHILERTIRAIWHAHGDAMADAIGRDHPVPETLDDRRPGEYISDPNRGDEAAFDPTIPF